MILNFNKKVESVLDFYLYSTEIDNELKVKENEISIGKTLESVNLDGTVNLNDTNRKESIAEEVYGMCLQIIASDRDDIDLDLALKIALLYKNSNNTSNRLFLYSYLDGIKGIDQLVNALEQHSSDPFRYDSINEKYVNAEVYRRPDESYLVNDCESLEENSNSYIENINTGRIEVSNYNMLDSKEKCSNISTILKNRICTEWSNNHFELDDEVRKESIAEHNYNACILALTMKSQYKYKVDINKVMRMLILQGSTDVLDEKNMNLDARVNLLFRGMTKKEELKDLIEEYNSLESNEAIFAYYCSEMATIIQAKKYDDLSALKPLECQKNNIELQDEKTKMMIKNGAITSFDILYEKAKGIFKNEPKLLKTLEYIKTNSMLKTFNYSNGGFTIT